MNRFKDKLIVIARILSCKEFIVITTCKDLIHYDASVESEIEASKLIAMATSMLWREKAANNAAQQMNKVVNEAKSIINA
jgi:hypothetical protein